MTANFHPYTELRVDVENVDSDTAVLQQPVLNLKKECGLHKESKLH